MAVCFTSRKAPTRVYFENLSKLATFSGNKQDPKNIVTSLPFKLAMSCKAICFDGTGFASVRE